MWKWLAIGFIIVAVVVGAALGFLYARTSGNLHDTEDTLAATQTELADTQDTLETTQSTLADTEDELASTQDNLEATQTELESTQGELADTKVVLLTTQDDLDKALADLELTEGELATTQSTLDSVTNELNSIKEVYPLKRFASISALRAWLDAYPTQPFTGPNVQGMMEEAARQGYLLSAVFEHTGNTTYIWLVAVLSNGDAYWFNFTNPDPQLVVNINTLI